MREVNVRVLIAEDQEGVGLFMTALVAKAGHQASLATDGYSAVKLASEVPPHVVLLDINMPGMDGYETARNLRKRYGDGLPIFAVTADPVNVALAQESGIDGVFSKPFDANKMTALMAELS